MLGTPCLKEERCQSIHAVYEGKDVFCLLYEFSCPPFFDHKLVEEKESCVIHVVVSPLVALMVNQVHRLRHSGVQVVIISSRSGLGVGLSPSG